MKKIILICGPKHSGKSLTARALQKILGCEATDLDDVVENQTGKTPRKLFREGREKFKKAEARALASLLMQNETAECTEPDLSLRHNGLKIIAAGGGLVDNNEALTLLSSIREMVIVYLDISAETAWQRIVHTAGDGELPPFLNTENPRETLLALHERRAGAYKALAHLTIAAESRSPEEIAKEITEFLSLPVKP